MTAWAYSDGVAHRPPIAPMSAASEIVHHVHFRPGIHALRSGTVRCGRAVVISLYVRGKTPHQGAYCCGVAAVHTPASTSQQGLKKIARRQYQSAASWVLSGKQIQPRPGKPVLARERSP